MIIIKGLAADEIERLEKFFDEEIAPNNPSAIMVDEQPRPAAKPPDYLFHAKIIGELVTCPEDFPIVKTQFERSETGQVFELPCDLDLRNHEQREVSIAVTRHFKSGS